MVAEETKSTALRATAFAETQWTVVIRAGHKDSLQAKVALEQLFRTYWFPLYGFVRKSGYNGTEAEDLTQGFFLHVTKHNSLQHVDQAKGKFRSFLLASLKNFLSNERARTMALKRGGGMTFVSLDNEQPEERWCMEPYHDAAPDTVFDRAWATTIVGNALAELREEYTRAGKADLFDVLQAHMCADGERDCYATTAESVNMSEAAVKMAVLRLRRRFGQVLRAHVAQTIAGDAEELDQELRYLFSALAA